MKYLAVLAVVIAAVLAQQPSRPPPTPCQTCDFLLRQAEHHFHNNVNDKAALLKELLNECQRLGRFEGPDAVTQCNNLANSQIDTIYADLSNGKDPWQTCADIGQCAGTEPTHHPRPTGPAQH